MLAWQTRLVLEERALAIRLDRLEAFTKGEVFTSLFKDEKHDLIKQLDYMKDYQKILLSRMARLGIKVDATKDIAGQVLELILDKMKTLTPNTFTFKDQDDNCTHWSDGLHIVRTDNPDRPNKCMCGRTFQIIEVL